MNIPKLSSYLNRLSISGDSDQAELVRTVIETAPYVPNEINDNVVLSGTTAATTTSFLAYGVNNITTASPTAYAIRLPYPPQKGKQVIIVNNSTMPVAVYPSVDGGSINGTLNGVGMVPNDGKAYTFYCYENPLPGAWSWSPPAINQFDSGEIIITTPGSSLFSTCVSPSFVVSSSTIVNIPLTGSSKGPLFGSVNQSGNNYVYAKPSTKWNSITKVKIYTNSLIAGTVGANVRLVAGGGYSLVNTVTNEETPWYPTLNNYYTSDQIAGATWQTVPGTPASGSYSANIGDAGTNYIELPCSLFSSAPNFDMTSMTYPNGKYSTFGSVLLGTQVDPSTGVTYEKWWTQTFSLQILPRGTAGQTLKLRFFIEYN